MQGRIMVLGAGVYQAPLIDKVRQLGFEAIVVSPFGSYPGIARADIHLPLDTTDASSIVAAAKEHDIQGITTAGTDVCLPALGRTVEALRLAGPTAASAELCADKVRMKRALLDHSVSTAPFEVFTEQAAARAFAATIGFPVMVKAPDSSGGRGITKVETAAEFGFAWDRARAVTRTGEIIVEAFLQGMEYGAQAFLQGDKLLAVFPHDDVVSPAPFFTPIGHSMPIDLDAEGERRTFDIIANAAKALGLRDCVANVDLMLCNGAPFMIEISPRIGATCLPESVSLFGGFDAYEYLVRTALGERPSLPQAPRQANASLLLQSHKTGIVQSVTVPPDVSENPHLVQVQCDVKSGDSVRAFRCGPDRIGHVIVKGETAAACRNLAATLASRIEIVVAEGDACEEPLRH